jgi:hypothetical protein
VEEAWNSLNRIEGSNLKNIRSGVLGGKEEKMAQNTKNERSWGTNMPPRWGLRGTEAV